MKWYQTNYCNHRDWILDNLDYLALSHTEILICLLIDFCNSNRLRISYDLFKNKLDLSSEQIDKIIYGLSAKGYLKVMMGAEGMTYDLSPLFETNIETMASSAYESIFQIFDDTFGRPLSGSEIAKLSELLKNYDKKAIIDALRTADAYQKVNMAYIEKVLINGSRED